MTDLGPLGGVSSAAAINKSGQVVGEASVVGGYHAFLWQNGMILDLGTLGGQDSTATAINTSGQVVGWSDLGPVRLAFLWQKGVMTNLGPLGGNESFAYGINDAGQIVGWSSYPDGDENAFLLQNGVVTNLGTLGGANSQAAAINGSGQVVGWSNLTGGSQHAFLWQKGVMKDLGILPGFVGSEASAINQQGQVVGSCIPANGNSHACIWQNGVLSDLNGFISAGSGWVLDFATAINDSGQIARAGNFQGQGETLGFLLTPYPTASPQTVSVDLGKPTAITLKGVDYDNPPLPLTFAIVSQPSNGTLRGLKPSTGAVTYAPKNGFKGTDSFTFTVSNGAATSTAATVTLSVAVGTPSANSQAASVTHNTATKITLTGTDPDNPALPLTFALKSEPAHGTVSGPNSSTGVVTYTPGANKYGPDSFTFTVSNGTNTSAPAVVTLNVAPGVPTANAQTVDVTENKPITITLTGSDPDNPALPLTFAMASSPAHGTLGVLNPATGKVTYTPDAKYTGSDSFSFTVSNGTNKSAPAKVTLNIGGGG